MYYIEELLSFCHRELVENKKANAALDKKLKEATLSVEISAKQELVAALEEAQQTAQEEKEQLLAQIEELRLKVRQAEEQHSE
jgi:tRNA A-37 threonylcarbamoyl transferase component Bud32